MGGGGGGGGAQLRVVVEDMEGGRGGVPGWGWQHSLRIKADSIAPTLTGHVGMAI